MHGNADADIEVAYDQRMGNTPRMMQTVQPPKRNWLVRYLEWSRTFRIKQKFGPIAVHVACPHCHANGCVRTKVVKRKQGISGGKAIGAIITGGVSLLATGISRNGRMTQARCERCEQQWDF